MDRRLDDDGAAVTSRASSGVAVERLPRRAVPALIALPAAFLGLFFVWPVARIIWIGLTVDGAVSFDQFSVTITNPIVGRVAWFTLWQAVLSTALTLVIGLPGAYVLSRWQFRGASALRAAVTVPFVLPTVVVASAFLALLGPRSPFNTASTALFGLDGPTFDLRRTVIAILIAHVFFNYAVVVRTVGGLWAHLDPRLEDAARALGATRWRAFVEVTLPLLRPAIAAASAIVFLFTFTSFGVVLLLGGPGRATIEVEIHRATTQMLDLPLASVLALLQLVAVVSALVVYGRLQRKVPRQHLVASGWSRRPPRTRAQWAFLAANLATMFVLLAMPLLVLVERSFATGEGWSLDHYRALFSPTTTVLAVAPWQAIRNSLTFALAATLIALLVGGLAATAAVNQQSRFARLTDRALMVPLGTSAVTVGFGFLVAFNQSPVDFRTRVWLVPVAQALIATPFVVRTLLPVLQSIDQRLRDAAATLGASPWRVWREVDAPIISRAVLVAAGFAFAVTLGEFGATVFVARVEWPTMPVAIFRFLGRPGVTHFGQAMAMSTILMAVTTVAIAAIDRLRVGQIGRF